MQNSEAMAASTAVPPSLRTSRPAAAHGPASVTTAPSVNTPD